MRTAGPISVKFFVSCLYFRGESFYGRKFWKIPPEKSENWKNSKFEFLYEILCDSDRTIHYLHTNKKKMENHLAIFPLFMNFKYKLSVFCYHR